MRNFSIDIVWAKIQMAVAAIGGWLGYFLGGMDGLMIALIVFMVLDYITGMAKAWQAGELSSRVGIGGILKKVGYLVIVAVACVLDWLVRYGADQMGLDWRLDFLIASIVVIWLVINELISILENVAALGAPVPGFLQSLIKRLKVSVEDKVEPKEET